MQIRSLAFAACAAMSAQAVAASPLTLSYSLYERGDGTWRYTFVLQLKNTDGSWHAGDAYGWVVFGDQASGRSALEDWVGDPATSLGGAWDSIGFTAGSNNGPTLGSVRTLWTPAAVGDSITWSGVSSARLEPGELKWSSLLFKPIGGGRAKPAALFETGVFRCAADADGNGFVNGDDFDRYMQNFTAGNSAADFDHDGFVTGDDFDDFARSFELGC